MKFQVIDLVVLLIMIYASYAVAKKKSRDIEDVSTQNHEYAVHQHNYEEQNIPATIEDLQTDESKLIKIKLPPESNQKYYIRPKRGNKKFRHFVHVVKQARRKKKSKKSLIEQQRFLKKPKEITEVKEFRTFEETHDHTIENASPTASQEQHMTQAESKQYEIHAEQEFSEPDLDTNEQNHHEEKEYGLKELKKMKVKHHHHHHHHNHVKEIIKKVPEPYPVEKIVHVPVEKVVEKVVHVPKPFAVEKVIEKIVKIPVEKIVHVPRPYAVEKIVEKKVPYPVEKIVHVPVEKVIEKIVHVPKPYPVEKVIEKVVHVPVERIVEKIVHVPKPYPVEKIVNKVVHVPRPYPVIKPVPYPVEVKVPIQVEKHVPYPVEKKVPVPFKVEVEKKVPVPYKVEIEKKIPVYIHSHEPYNYEKPKNQNKQHPEDDIEGPDGFERFEPQGENFHQHDLKNFPLNQVSTSTRNNQNNINNPQGQIIYGSSPFDLRAEHFKQSLHNFNYGTHSTLPVNAVHKLKSNSNNDNNNNNSPLDLELSPSSINLQSEAMANPLARLTPINPIALPLQLFQIQPYPFQQPIVAA